MTMISESELKVHDIPVGKLDPNPCGSGRGIERGVEVSDTSPSGLTRKRLKVHRRDLADAHRREVSLEDLALDPYRGEIGDPEHGVARHDPLPLLDKLVQHHTGDGRQKRHGPAGLTGPLDLRNRFRRYIP